MKNILIVSTFSLLALSGCTNQSDLSIVNQEEKMGAINTKGKIALSSLYEDVSWFSDVNEKNIKNTHPNYFNFHWLHNYDKASYSIVKLDGKYGIANSENKILLKPIYDSIKPLFNGISLIEKDGKYGYLNKDFKVIKEPVYEEAREFIQNVSFVKDADISKWACISKDMKLKTLALYDEVYTFSDDLVRVKQDGKWGYLNAKCEEVVKPMYEYAYDFSNGYAKVIKDKKVAFINQKGKELTKNIFNSASNF